MLDLSFLSLAQVNTGSLAALLQPPQRQLPSLRILGLRGTHLLANRGPDEATSATSSCTIRQSYKRELSRALRRDRALYLKIIWDSSDL